MTDDSSAAAAGRPPVLAEYLLRLSLKHEDRETVSGDLLEVYRDSVLPTQASKAARWYWRQVAWFVLRATLPWAALFSAAFLARQAWDWFVPTQDFVFRSEVTTYTAVAILLLTAFIAAWRSRSFVAGVAMTAIASQVAAIISILGICLLYAGWHDPETLRMVQNSGGIEENFLLPFMAIVPAIVLGVVGAAAGVGARRLG